MLYFLHISSLSLPPWQSTEGGSGSRTSTKAQGAQDPAWWNTQAQPLQGREEEAPSCRAWGRAEPQEGEACTQEEVSGSQAQGGSCWFCWSGLAEPILIFFIINQIGVFLFLG